ncbi:hypothetical protein QLQ12_43205 [Actinoplanes sp. NEAU-A12]|uniref:Uncharacterized protein n=1 Tax=Actinoplanes sandaracinus TaxID=3045177 RepID=A0ABT6X0C7_9ACTN|nr:hypothetical protein [Actinoplanes sandaracinus]MDI6105412.1 hypothetical protein [Actinoplanes sandaracinus]
MSTSAHHGRTDNGDRERNGPDEYRASSISALTLWRTRRPLRLDGITAEALGVSEAAASFRNFEQNKKSNQGHGEKIESMPLSTI